MKNISLHLDEEEYKMLEELKKHQTEYSYIKWNNSDVIRAALRFYYITRQEPDYNK